MSASYITVASLPDLRPGRSQLVTVDDHPIALWRVGDDVFAIDNVCPHQHFPVLHQASLNGSCVTCPMHGWTFDLPTGRAVNGNGRVRTHAIRLEGDRILVERPGSLW